MKNSKLIPIRDIKLLLESVGIKVSTERIRQLARPYATVRMGDRKGIGGGVLITSAKAKKLINYFIKKDEAKKLL